MLTFNDIVLESHTLKHKGTNTRVRNCHGERLTVVSLLAFNTTHFCLRNFALLKHGKNLLGSFIRLLDFNSKGCSNNIKH